MKQGPPCPFVLFSPNISHLLSHLLSSSRQPIFKMTRAWTIGLSGVAADRAQEEDEAGDCRGVIGKAWAIVAEVDA